MTKLIKRELIKVDNNDGSYHYEFSNPVEVDADKEFPSNPIREWFMRLLTKLLK